MSPPQVCQGPGVLFMESPEFVLARLWVTSTHKHPPLQRLAAGRNGQRGVCCQQCCGQHKVGSKGSLAAVQGEESHQMQEKLRHFSQAFLAEPSTGPAAHRSPLEPKGGSVRGQWASSMELSRVDHGQGGFRGAKTTCLETLEPQGAQGKERAQRELGTHSLHSPTRVCSSPRLPTHQDETEMPPT